MEARTDPESSQRYVRLLGERLKGVVLDELDKFCCDSGAECRTSVGSDGFAAGQLSYVGDHYATESAGRPLRVLVVSMQVGDDEAPVTLERRREQIRARISEPFSDRNQHMAGVTTALRLLFGGEPGADGAGEWLSTPTGPVHVLDAYAMANSVLCSRRPGRGRTGSPSAKMLRNCRDHLRATIEVLEPVVIQSQGRAARVSTHQAVERAVDTIRWLDGEVAEVTVGGASAVWCSLRHPARNWGQLQRAYLREVAAPALKRARYVALRL
jgi:hypothetical protein